MKLLPTTLLAVSLLTSMSTFAKTIRLVVHENQPSPSKAKSKSVDSCVHADDTNAKWCLPTQKTKSSRSNSALGKSQSSFTVYDLETQGHSADEVKQKFNKDGRFGLVEVDIEITAHNFRPNDPSLVNQTNYYESSENSVSGANIFGLWDALGESAITEKNDPVDIIVMDSGFVTNDDVPYFDGRGFSTTALVQGGPNQKRSDDFYPPAEVAELNCNAHGLGVASTLGATMNNNIGIAGVTNNANLYAIKVMTCGRGFLSDVAAALNWLAGEKFEGVSPYQGKPGVVNMSIGGSSGTCPSYMQDAINNAVDAGFTLVASAGNDRIDVADNAPANCDNVIAVGALNQYGDLADFSNFGSKIDVVTQGTDILGHCSEANSNACWWEGTSFSAPLVAGGLSVIKQVTGANKDELFAALQISSSLDNLSADCQTGVCGQGLPDFAKALEISQGLQAGTLHSIEFALNDSDVCEQAWFIDYFGGKARMCELYKISFFGGYIGSNMTYQLFSINVDGLWSNDEEVNEGIFEQGTAMLSGLDITSKKYGFKVCQNGQCGNVIEMDTTNPQEGKRPIACENQ